MEDKEIFAEPFDQESGAGTGDHRENDPRAPGFAADEDRFWRSQFQHANRLADRAYEQVRPAFELGRAAAVDVNYRGLLFEDVESDLENGWLNAKTAVGDWGSVREYARAAFEGARLPGYVQNVNQSGSDTPNRASFSDPLADKQDPTSAESPEQAP